MLLDDSKMIWEAYATKYNLTYLFKCTDADEDGIFEDSPFGTIDTDEFSEFIQSIERNEITREYFIAHFNLPKHDNILSENPDNLTFYTQGRWVVIFDTDVHFIYKY